jgi:hypothetical protein
MLAKTGIQQRILVNTQQNQWNPAEFFLELLFEEGQKMTKLMGFIFATFHIPLKKKNFGTEQSF